ncbi:MAG: EutN/CcmL family microcompartment protein [Deltaproteobacteria bacterium]|nr:EutN/CcmL family microcompartment protein [Deltaproteobacteria bacterium]
MIRGVVLGQVWATKRNPRLAGKRLLLVAEVVEDAAGRRRSGRVVVAADDLDARVGDAVVVAFGSGARNAEEACSRDVLSDAAIVQIIDSE